MEKETYLGVDVAPLTYKQMTKQLMQRIENGESSTIIAVNPEKIMKSQTDETLRSLINNSTFQIPDGVGVLLASQLSGGSIQSRVTGVEMMGYLLHMAEQRKLRVFFYGAKEEVVTKAIEEIQKKHPQLDVAGYENGYEQDQDKVISHIQESEADILLIALGSPKQELWIQEHKDKLPVKVYQGVGGSFDVYAGHVKRAPAFFRRYGLEWLYRLLSEPKRLKRQLALPKFLIAVIKERFFNKR